jgi:HEAT repeat protein
LSRFKDKRSIDVLVLALADTNEEIRQLAATGLGDIGDSQAVAALERAAQNDTHADARDAAAKAIEQIKAREKSRQPENRKKN